MLWLPAPDGTDEVAPPPANPLARLGRPGSVRAVSRRVGRGGLNGVAVDLEGWDAGGVPDDVWVSDRLTIPAGELSWRFSRAGGPGGQGVNTTDSRVRLSARGTSWATC